MGYDFCKWENKNVQKREVSGKPQVPLFDG